MKKIDTKMTMKEYYLKIKHQIMIKSTNNKTTNNRTIHNKYKKIKIGQTRLSPESGNLKCSTLFKYTDKYSP